jgi:hypothetical protein
VIAPLVGASSIAQLDDAVASLRVELTGDDIWALEQHYAPRYDFQGLSSDADAQRIMAQIPQFTTA